MQKKTRANQFTESLPKSIQESASRENEVMWISDLKNCEIN